MQVFSALFFRLLPLYALIVLGFIAGKYLHINRESIAKLLIYIIAPVVFFHAVLSAPIALNSLSLPVLYFIIPTVLCIGAYAFSRVLWQDTTRNIFAFSAGNGNTGYFGLPIAMMLFNEQVVGLYIMGIMGINLYESMVGFFVVARGQHTIQESIVKVIKLPALYAFLLGILFNILRWTPSIDVSDFITQFRGAYTILGMMMIGMGLASFKRLGFDGVYIVSTLFVRFIIWPIVTFSIIWLDQTVIHFLSTDIYRAMILLSIVPLAANTVAFASLFRVHPEKAAIAVLISTLVGLFYVPLMVSLFLPG